MENLQGFSFYPVEFTKDGQMANPGRADELLAGLTADHTTDLLVLSHGWNNNMAEARDLYSRFLGCVRPLLDANQKLAGRHFAVLGVFWPSVMFADAELSAVNAAGLDSPVTNDMIKQELERLKGVFDAPDADDKLTQAQALVSKLANHEWAQVEFADLLRSVLAPSTQGDTDAAATFQSMDGADLFARLSAPPPTTASPADAPAASVVAVETPLAGHAAGIGSGFFGGVKAAAMNVLNLTTYYQMKNRAGLVGQGAVNALLRQVRATLPAVRLHLVGHSFGCRLLSAATAGADGASGVKVDSMTLLQGAFSHYGFSDKYDEGGHAGSFRRVLANHLVAGPILVSHTRNDRAVGTMYPLASRLAGQVAAALGDANDQYGGLGSNGAQKTPEARNGQLLDVGAAYTFEAGQVHNLLADTYISGHSDICHPQTAYAFLQAVAST